MDKTRIGFIGSGNMARALIGGLCDSGVPTDNIYSFDPDTSRLESLCDDFDIRSASSNQSMLDNCDVIVLAIKPQSMQAVISELKVSNQKILFLSIAAGIRCSAFSKWFGQDVAMVRAMPNTPALVRAGATGLYATAEVSSQQRELAENIMRSVGITLWTERESDLDTVTALSGSGPAYFFYLMEAMEKAGESLGLSAETARLLSVQTAFGAAKLALEVDEAPEVLREKVTSPGGTTAAAIQHLDKNACRDILQQAVNAAHDRSNELAEQLEKSS
jgi:pyrroline-5-carboxylate reductase